MCSPEFGNVSTQAFVALSSGELNDETIRIVEQSRAIGRDYDLALENFLIELDKEPSIDERAHRFEWATRLKALLSKEMDILRHHPTLRPIQ
ncbi:MAG: hypothetical protein M3209_07450 [Acidobacteriota bacterium]|nr:hypothetical protein [Acidobacteriota bacterium]